MTHDIITLYYPPTDKAKELYCSMKENGHDIHFINCGNLSTDDEWVKSNVEFETQMNGNIAHMNQHLCELTTFYYVWNHLSTKWSDGDYVQHIHYRKMLDIEDPNGKNWVCAPYPMLFNVNGKRVQASIYDGTRLCHPHQSWDIMEEVVMNSATMKERDWWIEWMTLGVMPAPMNLFVLQKPLFDEYCEWVFPKVFEIERRIPYGDEEYQTAYQRRALAFIGERLFSYWCYVKTRRGVQFNTAQPKIFNDFKPITDEEERGKKL